MRIRTLSRRALHLRLRRQPAAQCWPDRTRSRSTPPTRPSGSRNLKSGSMPAAMASQSAEPSSDPAHQPSASSWREARISVSSPSGSMTNARPADVLTHRPGTLRGARVSHAGPAGRDRRSFLEWHPANASARHAAGSWDRARRFAVTAVHLCKRLGRRRPPILRRPLPPTLASAVRVANRTRGNDADSQFFLAPV